VAWTTTTELFGEIESTLRSILASENATKLPQGLKDDLQSYLAMLEKM
jgi:hypothetical protein